MTIGKRVIKLSVLWKLLNYNVLFFDVFLPLSTSFCVSIYFIPRLIKVACKLNIVDFPNSSLKTQATPVPYLGGLCVYLGFLVALSFWLPFYNEMFLFVLGISILLIVGLIDDIIELSPIAKIVGQLLGSLCFLKAGFFLKENFFGNFFNIFISIFWFLTVINAYNLVDVMDGLASSLAISNALIFLLLAIIVNQTNVTILLAAFVGALIGFFLFNKPQAKIYLGDSGSLFIGGFLAAVPFFFSWSESNFLGFFSPIFITAIPLLELASLILIRLYKGISPFKGSKDHFSTYLILNGWTKNKILIFSFTCSIIWGLLGLLFVFNYINFLTLVMCGIAFLFFWLIVIDAKKHVAFGFKTHKYN